MSLISANIPTWKNLLLPWSGMRGKECHTRACASCLPRRSPKQGQGLQPKGQHTQFIPLSKALHVLLREGCPLQVLTLRGGMPGSARELILPERGTDYSSKKS